MPFARSLPRNSRLQRIQPSDKGMTMMAHRNLFPRLAAHAALLTLLSIFSLVSYAQSPRGDVQVRLTQQKVIKGEDGKDKLVAAERVRPGDVVEYRATYSNTGKDGVKELQATLPVPFGMHFVPGSAQPANVQASLDNRKFEPLPIKRKVTLPDGKVEEREVPASEYKALRWPVGALAGGKSTVVSARMEVEPAVQAAAEVAR
jgi:uncharacterized repeat protein (TIGR01451 family)